MGASYSAATLKTQLKMSVQRLMMHRNKKSNQISVDSKTVAILLQQGKDESARIRGEAIYHEKNLVQCMEMLQLMCELLTARTALITAAQKTCPTDLEEGIASVIYCSTRLEIPELKIVAEQLGAKFTKEWVLTHLNNESGKVNPRIIEKLSIQPPPFEVVINMLHEIAATYQIEWQPNMDALESGIIDHSNPEQLGSIAKIVPAQPGAPSTQESQLQPIAVPQQQNPQYPSMLMNPPRPSAGVSPATQSSASSTSPPFSQYPIAEPNLSAPHLDQLSVNPGAPTPFPGTLNIILHRARNILNVASSSEPHDLYVRLTNLQTHVTWKSEADHHGGPNPVWAGNPNLPGSIHHFPFSVTEPTHQIQIEIVQKNSGTFNLKEDKVMGSAVFYADNLRANPQCQWYGLYSTNLQIGYILLQTQYIPLNASILSQEELNQQRAWLAEEERARLNGFQSSSSPISQQQQPTQQQTPGGYGGPPPVQSGGPGGPPMRLTDRVGAMFQEPPESPPHQYGRNLSDLMQPSSTTTATAPASSTAAQPSPIPTSYDSTHVESKEDVVVPDPSYQALSGNGEVDLDFPAVPTHSAGSGRRGSGNSNDGTDSGKKKKPKGGNDGFNSSGGGGGGMGGTIYAPPRPKKVDEDAELEARFKRLQ